MLGIGYLAAAGRWREALKVAIVGAAVLGVSLMLGPDAWRQFLEVVGARAGTDGGTILPIEIPFAVRFALGGVLAIVAGRWLPAGARGASARGGEALLIVALVVANPTLWATAFSMLVAIVPLWRSRESSHRKRLERRRVVFPDAHRNRGANGDSGVREYERHPATCRGGRVIAGQSAGKPW